VDSTGRLSGNRMQTLLQKHLEQATLLSHTVSEGKKASLFSLPTRALSMKDVRSEAKLDLETDYDSWDLIVWVF